MNFLFSQTLIDATDRQYNISETPYDCSLHFLSKAGGTCVLSPRFCYYKSFHLQGMKMMHMDLGEGIFKQVMFKQHLSR